MNCQDIGACDFEVIKENTSVLYYNITTLELDPGRILQVNLKPSRAWNKYRAQHTPTLEPLKLLEDIYHHPAVRGNCVTHE